MRGDGTGQLVLRAMVAREIVIRLNATTGGSMLSDDDVLSLVRTSSVGIFRGGGACGLGPRAQMISNGLQSVACSRKSKSLCAYEVCRKALELYSQEDGIGEFFYIVNSRLRRVKSIENPTPDCFVRAITESCGDLADFVRLVWEGLNFEFREAPRGGCDIPRSGAFGG
jgi:hypothetical protein